MRENVNKGIIALKLSSLPRNNDLAFQSDYSCQLYFHNLFAVGTALILQYVEASLLLLLVFIAKIVSAAIPSSQLFSLKCNTIKYGQQCWKSYNTILYCCPIWIQQQYFTDIETNPGN